MMKDRRKREIFFSRKNKKGKKKREKLRRADPSPLAHNNKQAGFSVLEIPKFYFILNGKEKGKSQFSNPFHRQSKIQNTQKREKRKGKFLFLFV